MRILFVQVCPVQYLDILKTKLLLIHLEFKCNWVAALSPRLNIRKHPEGASGKHTAPKNWPSKISERSLLFLVISMNGLY